MDKKEQIEKELKEVYKRSRDIAGKVVLGTAAFGAVYLLGAHKGMKIGHARGYLDGYVKATHDIADMIRQGVSSIKDE